MIGVSGWGITLGTERERDRERLYVSVCVFARKRFRGTRCHYLELPFSPAIPFFSSATAQAAGKGFSENGGREIDPTRGFTTPVPRRKEDLTKGVFMSAGTRAPDHFFGQEGEKWSVSLHLQQIGGSQ